MKDFFSYNFSSVIYDIFIYFAFWINTHKRKVVSYGGSFVMLKSCINSFSTIFDITSEEKSYFLILIFIFFL